jgi:hypothetical protein
MKWFKQHGSLLVLAAIIICAVSLSTYWAFLVPMLEGPDEQAHLDYALNIYSAGRLLNAREPFHSWNVGGPETDSAGPDPGEPNHVYTLYLISVSNLLEIHFNPAVKVPQGYGTRAFYEQVDRNAPGEMSGNLGGRPRRSYGFLGLYPYGYYGLLATWMRLISHFSNRLTVLFFGARLFSALLLGFSLTLVFGTARELHVSRMRSLLYTALVGFFPLTSFVSSYVQADNLSFTLVMLSFYLALRLRRSPQKTRTILVLGLALGMLCVTKYQYYLCTLLPIVGMVVADKLAGRIVGIGWLRLFTYTFLGALMLLPVQVWVTWGSGGGALPHIPSARPYDAFLASAHNPLDLLNFVTDMAGQAYGDFYLDGSTFSSFWGHFGWMDTSLTIVSPEVNKLVRHLIALLNVVTFGLVLIRFEKIATLLVSLARNRRWRKALSILFSNPALNACFLFTIFMFLMYVLSQRNLAGQGRYWWPFIFPIFLIGTQYAPRALSHRRTRAVFSWIMTIGLILYCIVGSIYAIQSVTSRYYGP